MNLLNTSLAFLFVLGVTIFVHEFGHFITAKAFGIRVFVFSFGFGRRLLGFKWGDTDCRLSLVPLGGYVKLEGEADDRLSEDTSHLGDARDFTARPRWQRVLVYLAGPLMNGVLTVGVLTGVYMHGADIVDLSDAPIIGLVEAGSPAAQASLQPGDEFLAIEGEPQKTWEDVLMTVALRPNRDLRVRFRRDGEELEAVVHSRANDRNIGELGAHPLVLIGGVMTGAPAALAGLRPGDVILRIDGQPIHAFEEVPPLVQRAGSRPLAIEVSRQGQPRAFAVAPKDGRIGISGGRMIYRKLSLLPAVAQASRYTVQLARQTLVMLGQLVTAHISPKAALSGPVEIFRASGEAARNGMIPLVMLTALISLSVGVLNLFPLPPLDGGHLAILVIESGLRRDLSLKAKTWLINVGAAVLLLLIAVVLYFDMTKQAWFQRFFAS